MLSSIWVAVMTYFAAVVDALNNHLLDDRHVLQRDLNAHVAAGNHDAVRDAQDLVDIVDALGVLNLGDNLDGVAAVFLQNSRICRMSCAQRVKEAAMKSKPASMPNLMSSRSLSLKYGIDSSTFGTLTPLWSEMGPPLSTTHWISLSLTFCTCSSIRPSSMRMRSPSLTSFVRS